MSQFIYPSFEKNLFYSMQSGEGLVQHLEELDKIAEKLGIKSITAFDGLSNNPAFIEEISNYDGDPMDIFDKSADQALWYEPADGLNTIEKLLAYFSQDPKSAKKFADAIDDLKDLQKALEIAHSKGTRFRINIDN